MKLLFGKIPEKKSFQPEQNGWVPMREPSPWLAQLLALPIAAATVTILVFLWSIPNVGGFERNYWLWLIAWIIGLVIAHEAVHGIIHPGAGATSDSVFGFWPSRLLLYAHYEGILTRNRFVAILLGPFVCLSLMPLIAALAVGAAPFHLAFASAFNGLLACVDILGAILLLAMVPRGAQVRNKGWKTFYRTVEPSSSEDG